jgi:hypothetical protein
MWHGYERMFYNYLVAIKDECVHRGISVDANWQAIKELMRRGSYNFGPNLVEPWWYADREMLLRIIQTHRANLYKKDPEYYYDYIVNANMYDKMRDKLVCCPKCNYCWATHIAKQRQEKQDDEFRNTTTSLVKCQKVGNTWLKALSNRILEVDPEYRIRQY